ncbi:hypothetical protein BSL78_03613 [Apostichopus japonicus]|uniref:OAR domain-containing protein n=1 Tax=Stichopus japonicus TaxID=307972 RepID=A0A2G8LGU2_STIJA|nr:hypothetical protein BSL78_03613 [Apostichopus japonicus]
MAQSRAYQAGAKCYRILVSRRQKAANQLRQMNFPGSSTNDDALSDTNEDNKIDVEKTSYEPSKDSTESQKIKTDHPPCDDDGLEKDRGTFQPHKDFSEFRRYMAIPEPAFWNLSMCRASNRYPTFGSTGVMPSFFPGCSTGLLSFQERKALGAPLPPFATSPSAFPLGMLPSSPLLWGEQEKRSLSLAALRSRAREYADAVAKAAGIN